MKLFLGLILSAFVLQALAVPADFAHMAVEPLADPAHAEPSLEGELLADPAHAEPSLEGEILADPAHAEPSLEGELLADPAHAEPSLEEVKPKNEIVDAFREAIDHHFVRYQSFYDRTNAAMREYRLAHVNLVARIYNNIMTAFGDPIERVRVLSGDLSDMINARAAELGGLNPCLTGLISDSNVNADAAGARIQACAVTANTTLSTMLTDLFYPAFAQIQTETSSIPLSVIDVLSRGNVLEDEQAILDYLESRYEVFELQWLNLVSQMLRWETNKFEIDGMFLADDVNICMEDAIFQFILTNSRLEGEVQDC